jgi:glycerol kinase
MENDTRIRLKELRVDGGTCVNNLLMQCQANLLRVAVVCPRAFEATPQRNHFGKLRFLYSKLAGTLAK